MSTPAGINSTTIGDWADGSGTTQLYNYTDPITHEKSCHWTFAASTDIVAPSGYHYVYQFWGPDGALTPESAESGTGATYIPANYSTDNSIVVETPCNTTSFYYCKLLRVNESDNSTECDVSSNQYGFQCLCAPLKVWFCEDGGIYACGAAWWWWGYYSANYNWNCSSIKDINVCATTIDDQKIVSGEVDWGDGTTESITIDDPSQYINIGLEHTYTETGNYTVTVTFTDDVTPTPNTNSVSIELQYNQPTEQQNEVCGEIWEYLLSNYSVDPSVIIENNGATLNDDGITYTVCYKAAITPGKAEHKKFIDPTDNEWNPFVGGNPYLGIWNNEYPQNSNMSVTDDGGYQRIYDFLYQYYYGHWCWYGLYPYSANLITNTTHVNNNGIVQFCIKSSTETPIESGTAGFYAFSDNYTYDCGPCWDFGYSLLPVAFDDFDNYTNDNQHICPDGYHWDSSQFQCIVNGSDTPSDPEVCPTGWTWSDTYNKCLPPDNPTCETGHWNGLAEECQDDEGNPIGAVPPSVDSASTSKDGATIKVIWNSTTYPTTGSSGFSVTSNGIAISITSITNNTETVGGNTVITSTTLTLSRSIFNYETPIYTIYTSSSGDYVAGSLEAADGTILTTNISVNTFNDKYLYVCHPTGPSIEYINLTSGTIGSILLDYPDSGTSLDISHDGSFLITACGSGGDNYKISTNNNSITKKITTLRGLVNYIGDVSIDPSDSFFFEIDFVATPYDGGFRGIDITAGTERGGLVLGGTYYGYCVKFDPIDSSTVYLGVYDNGTLKIQKATTSSSPTVTDINVGLGAKKMIFNSDGTYLYFQALSQNRVCKMRMSDYSIVQYIQLDNLVDFDLSRDETFIIAIDGHDIKKIKTLDFTKVAETNFMDQSNIYYVAISGDTKSFYYSYYDNIDHTETIIKSSTDTENFALGIQNYPMTYSNPGKLKLLSEEYLPDVTPPTPNAASINTSGNQLTVTWTETSSKPVTGTTGLSIGGLTYDDITLSNVITNNVTTTATIIGRTIKSGESPKLNYTPGNFQDSATSPNTIEAFSDFSITNNSIQVYDNVTPAIASATINTNGDTLIISWSDSSLPVIGTSGLSLAGLTYGSVTLSNITTTGSTTTATIVGRTIKSNEEPTLSYAPGDFKDSADTGANEVEAFSDVAITNNSTKVYDNVGPIPDSATINSTGNLLTIVWNEDSLPVVGDTGLSIDDLSYGSVTLSEIETTGNTTTATITGRTIKSVETPTLNYSSGNIKDSADTGSNNASDFSEFSIANNSEIIYDNFSPTVFSATINSTGNQLTIIWTENSLPIVGSTGLSIEDLTYSGVTLSDIENSGSTTTATIVGRTIKSGESPTLSYSLGDFKDSADTGANDVENFSDLTITNNSEQEYDNTAPSVESVTISIDGSTLTIVWDEDSLPVLGTSGLSLDNLTYGSVTLSDITTESDTTTATIIGRAVKSGEAPTLTYTPGNFKDSADTGANNVSGFSDVAVTNNSQYKEFIYVANYDDNNVYEIRAENLGLTNIISNAIDSGTSPTFTIIGKVNRKFYEINNGDNTIYEFNIDNNHKLNSITVGNKPVAGTISNDNTFLLIVNNQDNTVTRIDTSDDSITATIAVGNSPSFVLINSDDTKAYVLNSSDNTYSIINLSDNTVSDTITITSQTNPVFCAFNSDESKLYIANHDSSSISIIQTTDNSILDTITLSGKPSSILITSDNDYLYVTGWETSSIYKIQLSDKTISDTITVGTNPSIMIFGDGEFYIYSLNNGDNTLSAIKLSDNSILATIPVGNNPKHVAIADVIDSGITTPPTIISAEIDETGLNLSITWDNNVEGSTGLTLAGYLYGTPTLTAFETTDNVTTTTFSRPINNTEYLVLNYYPGDFKDSDTYALATIQSGLAVINNSLWEREKIALVSNEGGSSVSIIRLSDNKVINTITDLSNGAYAVEVDNNGQEFYVGQESIGYYEINNNELSNTHNSVLTEQPKYFKISKDNNYLYYVGATSKYLYKLNLSNNSDIVMGVPANQVSLGISADGTKLFSVESSTSNYLYILDTSDDSLLHTVTLSEPNPTFVCASPTEEYVYVCYATGKISKIGFDGTIVYTKFPQNSEGDDTTLTTINFMSISPDGSELYILTHANDEIWTLITSDLTLKGLVTNSGGSDNITSFDFIIDDLGNKQIYSVNSNSSTIGVWSYNSDTQESVELNTIPVGSSPQQIKIAEMSIIPDITAPTITSATIDTTGKILTINWDEESSLPILGSNGLTLSNLTYGIATLSNIVNSGTTTIADISRIITVSELPKLNYSSGDFSDSSLNPVVGFTNFDITNNSTHPNDIIPPALVSSSIDSTGTTLTINWAETDSSPVTGTTGLSIYNLIYGSVVLSNVTTTGTTTTATISRPIKTDEAPKLNYTPGNFQDSAFTPNTVLPFTNVVITNNSTHTEEEVPPIYFMRVAAKEVDIVYQNDISDTATQASLLYRLYGNSTWISSTDSIIKNTVETINNLTEVTEYEFVFRIQDGGSYIYGPVARAITKSLTDVGETAPSEPILTNPSLPSAMTAIIVTTPDAVLDGDKFIIEKSLDQNTWTVIDALINPNTSYTNTGLTPNTEYFYRVVRYGVSEQQCGAIGYTASIWTYPGLPTKPGNMVFSNKQDTSVDITLPTLPSGLDTSPFDQTVTFKLYEGTSSAPNIQPTNWALVDDPDVTPGGTITISNLTDDDTIYWFRLDAVNISGTTQGTPQWIDHWTTPPGIPQYVEFDNVGGTHLTVLSPVSLPDRCYYLELNRGLTKDSMSKIDGAILTPGGNPYIDTNLSLNTDYVYCFSATNSGGTTYGDFAGIKTNPSDEPVLPSTPVLEVVGVGRIKVTGPEILPEFTISLSLQMRDENDSWVTIATNIYSDTYLYVQDGTNDVSLEANHTYEFRWIGINPNDTTMGPSSSVYLAAPSTPPGPLSLIPFVNKINMTTPSTLPDRANHFRIEVKNSDNSYTTLIDNLSSGQGYDYINLNPITSYTVRAVAIGYYGEIAGSDQTTSTLSYGDASGVLPSIPSMPVINTALSTSLIVNVPNPFTTNADYLELEYRKINESFATSSHILPSDTTFELDNLSSQQYYELYWKASNSKGSVRGDSLVVTTIAPAPDAPLAPVLANN